MKKEKVKKIMKMTWIKTNKMVSDLSLLKKTNKKKMKMRMKKKIATKRNHNKRSKIVPQIT